MKPDQPERRYLHVDVSQWGQMRYYVQLRNKLLKIRIKAEFGTPDFEAEVDTAIAAQIAIYGNESDYINAQKQRNEPRPALPTTPPNPGTLGGTGASTSAATTGLAISASANRALQTRHSFSAPA